jgi:hypothetical protein
MRRALLVVAADRRFVAKREGYAGIDGLLQSPLAIGANHA